MAAATGGWRGLGVGGMRWGETPRAPPLWIPAFAGMTGGWLRANGVVDGGCDGGWRGLGVGGMRWGETPRAPPLWIPAFAGMTGGCRGRRGVVVGWGPFDRLRANGVVDGGCDGGLRWGGGVGWGIGGLWVLGVCYGCWGVEAGAGRRLACAAERLIGVDVETCRRWGAIPVSQISGGRDDLLL